MLMNFNPKFSPLVHQMMRAPEKKLSYDGKNWWLSGEIFSDKVSLFERIRHLVVELFCKFNGAWNQSLMAASEKQYKAVIIYINAVEKREKAIEKYEAPLPKRKSYACKSSAL